MCIHRYIVAYKAFSVQCGLFLFLLPPVFSLATMIRTKWKPAKTRCFPKWSGVFFKKRNIIIGFYAANFYASVLAKCNVSFSSRLSYRRRNLCKNETKTFAFSCFFFAWHSTRMRKQRNAKRVGKALFYPLFSFVTYGKIVRARRLQYSCVSLHSGWGYSLLPKPLSIYGRGIQGDPTGMIHSEIARNMWLKI